MYQEGFRLNPGERRKMIIFRPLLTIFEVSKKFEAAGAVVTIGFSLKSNHKTKLSLILFEIEVFSELKTLNMLCFRVGDMKRRVVY